MIKKDISILVSGNDRLTFSITVCLMQAGHNITLLTSEREVAYGFIEEHMEDLGANSSGMANMNLPIITGHPDASTRYELGIIITEEVLEEKLAVIAGFEKYLSGEALLLINSETIPLSVLQQKTINPARIMAVNWVEPAHTTLFLEIIWNNCNDKKKVTELSELAVSSWKKDPYLATDTGIRSLLMGALVREACYLIKNHYSSIEDIDRACRNDPGYYLPFAGNFRYMDLMGTKAYGLVMKELNPELSKDRQLPAFFKEMLHNGKSGMHKNRGFYDYTNEDVAEWVLKFRKFSYEIESLIRKYPFEEDDLTDVQKQNK